MCFVSVSNVSMLVGQLGALRGGCTDSLVGDAWNGKNFEVQIFSNFPNHASLVIKVSGRRGDWE